MESDSRVFLFEEVAEHNKKDDGWLIISEKVYDVTSFLDDHPGGDEILLTATGKDATEEFEDVGHSDRARELLKKYYVGKVVVSSLPGNKAKHTLHRASSQHDWIRKSIACGINSVVQQIVSFSSPQELQVERCNILQSLDTLQAMATPNNVDLSWFTSQVRELVVISDDISATTNVVDLERVEKLSADLAQHCADLASRHAELPQLSKESLFLKEQEAELLDLKEKIKTMDADLTARKHSLETKSVDLRNSIQQCVGEIQRLRDELDQAGQSKVEELNGKKRRLQGLVNNLTMFAPVQ